MSLADTVTPINPFTVLKWFSKGDRDNFITDRSVPAEQVQPAATPLKTGIFGGAPFYIYEDNSTGKQTFLGRSMTTNPTMMWRADRWEYFVWDFEDKHGPIYFERT